MRTALRILFLLITSALIPLAASAQSDAENSQDPPGMNRMPSYYIREYTVTEFDSVTFKVTAGNRTDE